MLMTKLNNAREFPLVMGILNVTPDSFSDGGCYLAMDKIKQHVDSMVVDGADIIDIGGESTRPGALEVSLEAELERVMPVIEWVKQSYDVLVSVDTYKTEVMKASISQGVDLINDVNALQSEGAVEVLASSDTPVCLMHKKGGAAEMHALPEYENVVEEVKTFLVERAKKCVNAGVAHQNIILDPGFGFGKNLEHNVALFEQLESFVAMDYPILVGVSKKRMIGELLGNVSVDERMVGSVAASIVAAFKGAKILRVHDVKETVQALKVAMALV